MDYKLTKLANGLKLLVVEMPNLESVAVTLWVRVGSRYEPASKSGITHFLEHMVFKGTPKRPTALDVSKAIDSIGAEGNAGTSREWTNYYLKARAGQLEKAYDLLSDIVLNPLLRQEDIDREKGVIIEEIAMKEDVPAEKIADKFVEMVFAGNPLSRDIAGTPETVSSFKRNDFVSYRTSHYDALNIILTVSGGIKEKKVKELTQKYFSNLSGRNFLSPRLFGLKQNKPRLHLEYKKSEQAHFFLGYPAYQRNHPKRYAESLLVTILGQGMSSRLFTEVREKRGLAYAVGSSVSRFVDAGMFATYAGVDIKKAEEAIKVILEQKQKIADKSLPIAEDELKKAKEYLKGRMALALEDTLAVNDFFGKQVMFIEDIKNPEEVFTEIDRVTIDDIYKVAKDVIRPEKLNLAIIGPFKSEAKFEMLLK
jgi:predicted Zn-dependent peptidase